MPVSVFPLEWFTAACSCHTGVTLDVEAPRPCNHLRQSEGRYKHKSWLSLSKSATSSDLSFIYSFWAMWFLISKLNLK